MKNIWKALREMGERELDAAFVAGNEHGRREERAFLMARVEYAEGWRYGAMACEALASAPAPAPALGDTMYVRGWNAGLEWAKRMMVVS